MSARVSAKKPTGGPAGPDNSGAPLSSSRVQSVDRAVSLLRAVADAGRGGAATVALGESCGLNRATAWRLLSTLETHGLVVSDRASGRWSLGPGLVDIARSAGSEVVLRDVHEVLQSVALQTGETAALAVLRHGALTYVDEVFPTHDRVGELVRPAGQPARDLDGQGAAGLVDGGGAGPADAASPQALHRDARSPTARRLRADLDRSRERGYATCHGEFDASAWGVSAPVLDRTGRLLAVLSIWGPPTRVVPERFPALGRRSPSQAAAKMAPR